MPTANAENKGRWERLCGWVKQRWQILQPSLNLTNAASAATVAGLVITIVAVFVAWITYNSAKQDDRTAATLQYDARLKSGSLLSGLFVVEDARESDAFAKLSGKTETKRDLETDYPAFEQTYNLRKPSLTFADFFDDFYVCARQNICDLRLGLTLFGPDLDGVYMVTHIAYQHADDGKAFEYKIGCGETALDKVFREPKSDWRSSTLAVCQGL